MTNDYPYASPPDAVVWQPPPLRAEPARLAPHETPSLGLLSMPLLALLAGANASMVPVALLANRGALAPLYYAIAVLGAMAAQAAALTLLVVFGGGPLWRRMAWHWGWAVVLLGAWAYGLTPIAWEWLMQPRGISWDAVGLVVLSLPLLALVSQAVPWFFKLYLGWRIEWQGDAQEPSGKPQLSIRDLLGGTVVVGIALAAARAARPADVAPGSYWLGWSIIAAVVVGLSLVALLPLLVCTLGVRRARWAVLGVIGHAALAVSVLLMIMVFVVPAGGPPIGRLGGTLALVGGFTATLAGLLAVARRAGYRLVRPGVGRTFSSS